MLQPQFRIHFTEQKGFLVPNVNAPDNALWEQLKVEAEREKKALEQKPSNDMLDELNRVYTNQKLCLTVLVKKSLDAQAALDLIQDKLTYLAGTTPKNFEKRGYKSWVETINKQLVLQPTNFSEPTVQTPPPFDLNQVEVAQPVQAIGVSQPVVVPVEEVEIGEPLNVVPPASPINAYQAATPYPSQPSAYPSHSHYAPPPYSPQSQLPADPPPYSPSAQPHANYPYQPHNHYYPYAPQPYFPGAYQLAAGRNPLPVAYPSYVSPEEQQLVSSMGNMNLNGGKTKSENASLLTINSKQTHIGAFANEGGATATMYIGTKVKKVSRSDGSSHSSPHRKYRHG